MNAPAMPRASYARWGRPLVRLLVILIGAYVALVALMMFFENALVFQPTSAQAHWVAAPAGTRDVVLTSADGTEIHGWWLPCPGASGALLYLHGNAGNLSFRADTVGQLRKALDLSVLIIDYPGFGKSTGSPSEEGCYRAADAAYDWLVQDQKIAPTEIVLFGKSLGGGVATELASRRDHRALALVKTYTSLPDVAGHLYPFIPVQLLMRNRFDSISRIAACRRPVFVAHGTADELIPFELGQRLYEAANEPKEFFTMPGHGHNDPFPAEFYTALREFLRKHS
jgi:uncharacterized protein